MFDYGRVPATWERVVGDPMSVDATDGDDDRRMRLMSDLRLGIEGVRRPRPPPHADRRDALLRAVVVAPARRPAQRRGGRPHALQTTSRVLARLAGRRQVPRPPLARPSAAQRARPQGPDLRADRRDGRRPDDVAARDAGRRAQLGLPLHVDARRDLHAQRAELARPQLGGRRLHPVRRRRRAQRGRLAADHVRHRRRAGAARRRRSTTSPATRARRPVRIGNDAYGQRQNDVFGAVLDSIYLHTKEYGHNSQRLWPVIEDQVEHAIDTWQLPDQGIWEARGEPKHYTSSQADVLGRAGPRRAPRCPPRQERAGRPLARGRQRDPRRDLRARHRRARRLHPALRHRRARRLAAADAARALPPPRRRARAATP